MVSCSSIATVDSRDPAMEERTSVGIILDLSFPSSVSHAVDQHLHRDAYEQMKKSSLFLMHLKEERLLTQAGVNDVIAEVFHHVSKLE